MNSINRNNYETFFLLYIDNELSNSERKAVDEFVQANPDLEEELVMLQQSIVQPDEVVFDDKTSLLKNDFTPSAVQEMLLMHLDDELTPTRQNEIAALIKADPQVESEWNILQQTKLLQDNSFVFENKAALYRNSPGRLVPFKWWRMAAAAVIIGLGVWGGVSYLRTGIDLNINNTARNNPLKPATGANSPATNKIIAPVTVPEREPNEMAVVTENPNKLPGKKPVAMTEKRVQPALLNRDIAVVTATAKTNDLPKPYSDNLNNIASNKTITATVTTETHPGTNVDAAANGNMNNGQDAASRFATTAAFTNNTMEESDNHIFLMDEERVKKTKLGGFIRKARRVLERNTNIKTGGNSIRVANLEFAIQ